MVKEHEDIFETVPVETPFLIIHWIMEVCVHFYTSQFQANISYIVVILSQRRKKNLLRRVEHLIPQLRRCGLHSLTRLVGLPTEALGPGMKTLLLVILEHLS